jgi:ketosteroid isomerase-like protein
VSAGPAWALFEAFRSGDEAALRRSLHPEIEISDPERTGAGPFRGGDEFITFTQEWLDTWDQYELGLEALVVVADTVVALVHYRGTAAGSGIPMDQRGALLLRVRDGLIAYFRPYTDCDEALEAAGLPQPQVWRRAIERLWAGYEAWNRRDFEALAAFLSDDMEVVPVTDLPDMAPFTGREPAERFWESSVATWETLRFTPLGFEPHGDQLLVEVRVNARARGSGIELEERMGHLYTLRDGEFVRLQAFTSSAEARSALAYPERG